ncbi:MAG: hypothetical protein ACOWWH_01015 [Eubacteriaceae bacterium]
MTGNVAAEVVWQAISCARTYGIYWAHEVLPLDFMNKYIFSKEQDFYEEKAFKIKNIADML